MSQPIARETIALIINLLSPYMSVNYENVMAALFASDIDFASVREAVKNQAHVGNSALIALVQHGLEKQLDFIHPNWTEQTITSIEKRIAGSGNITWKCELLNRDKPLFIRQQNKALFVEHYPQIEDMALNFVHTAEIKVYTSPDGDFLKLEKVIPGGKLNYIKVTADNLTAENTRRQAEAVHELGDLTTAAYADFESTCLGEKAEIVQAGLVIVDYGTCEKIKFLIKPEEPENLSLITKGKSAQDIHGISAEMLTNEKPFEEFYALLQKHIEGKTLVTYGDFDLKLLTQVCERHELAPIVPSRHVNLMSIYAKYHGEAGFIPGDYKWQSLEAAYKQMTAEDFVGAHDALCDAEALQTIVLKMQSSIESAEG
jgi:DNA polymerase III epsilon subunit-like protein